MSAYERQPITIADTPIAPVINVPETVVNTNIVNAKNPEDISPKILYTPQSSPVNDNNDLAAIMRKFSDDEKLIKDYSREGVMHLVGIEANTMNTVLELQKANLKLDTVISNTKPVYSGFGK